MTVFKYALRPDERKRLKTAAATAVGESFQRSVEAVCGAVKQHSRGDEAAAKRLWYAHLLDIDIGPTCERVEGSVTAARRGCRTKGVPSLMCRCRCRCSNCAAGLCMRCPTCPCKSAWRMGHRFGVLDQFFHHLAPPAAASCPFHFRTRPAWRCSACPYTFTAACAALHVPLHLPVDDVRALLDAGTAAEVGALCAAHLTSNPYDYGSCPQCGRGALRAVADEPQYSAFVLVELGRVDGGANGSAADRLPWSLQVAPRMRLRVAGADGAYEPAAVVYNNGSHWWADLLCSAHFAKRQRAASYRYDGLEEGGRLRYCREGALILTSDPRFVSLVLYRRVEP